MTEVVDSNACATLDNAVETLSFLRYLVLGSILAHRVYMLLPDDYCGKHPVKAWLLASWRFATTEGEHMLIYFGVSCLLDNAKIFAASSPSADICRADMLVSLYTVAGGQMRVPPDVLALPPQGCQEFWEGCMQGRSSLRVRGKTAAAGLWIVGRRLGHSLRLRSSPGGTAEWRWDSKTDEEPEKGKR